MPHLDPEQLSLLALYDDWDDPDGRQHLLVCSRCAADYAALRRTVEAVKATPDTSRLSVPGPQVWAGIHRELGLGEPVRADPLAAVAPKGAGDAADGAATPAATPAPADGPSSNVVRLGAGTKGAATRGNRGRTAWWQRPGTWLATAAAAVL